MIEMLALWRHAMATADWICTLTRNSCSFFLFGTDELMS